MQPYRMRFRLRWLMIAVMLVACALGTVAAFSAQPATSGRLLSGWMSLCGIPLALLVGGGVPFRRTVRTSGRFIVSRSPFAGLCGVLGFAVNGPVGLVGGFAAMMLIIGWASLFAPLFPDDVPLPQESLDVP